MGEAEDHPDRGRRFSLKLVAHVDPARGELLRVRMDARAVPAEDEPADADRGRPEDVGGDEPELVERVAGPAGRPCPAEKAFPVPGSGLLTCLSMCLTIVESIRVERECKNTVQKDYLPHSATIHGMAVGGDFRHPPH